MRFSPFLSGRWGTYNAIPNIVRKQKWFIFILSFYTDCSHFLLSVGGGLVTDEANAGSSLKLKCEESEAGKVLFRHCQMSR